MATPFQDFVNAELPKRVSCEEAVGGNLPAAKRLRTTGLGLQVELVDEIGGVDLSFDGSSVNIVADNVQGAIIETVTKFYQQTNEPTLGDNDRIAIWEDDTNRTFLLVKRPSDGQQVGVQLT